MATSKDRYCQKWESVPVPMTAFAGDQHEMHWTVFANVVPDGDVESYRRDAAF